MSRVKRVADIRRENLEMLVKQFGTLDALAASAGTTSVYLSQIRNRTPDKKTNRPREMGSAMAARLCAAAGKPDGWLDAPHPPSREGKAREIDLDANADYPSIRRVTFRLEAGVTGFAIEDASSDEPPIVFRRDWFDRHGYRPEKLFAARVNGASMEPTLFDGDLVVINTEQTEPRDGRAFALNYEGVLSIKRLVRDAGEWWIRSDNPDKRHWPDKRCHDGVVTIGEVVYRQSERV